jgi:hypothetical protein
VLSDGEQSVVDLACSITGRKPFGDARTLWEMLGSIDQKRRQGFVLVLAHFVAGLNAGA